MRVWEFMVDLRDSKGVWKKDGINVEEDGGDCVCM